MRVISFLFGLLLTSTALAQQYEVTPPPSGGLIPPNPRYQTPPGYSPGVPGQTPLCSPSMCMDSYCEDLRRMLLMMNACYNDTQTLDLLHRLRDAGDFYCTQKQQYHTTLGAALQNFDAIRPPPNSSVITLDNYAMQEAERTVCPGY
jgi:hypothetical protein